MPAKKENRPKGLGFRLRSKRVQANLTIGELARQAGLSTGYISLLERDRINPSMAALKALGDVLSVSMVELVAEDEDFDSDHAITNPGQRLRFSYPGSSAVHELLSSDTAGSIQFTLMHVPPQSTTGLQRKHRGEECAYVTKGTVRLLIGNSEYELGLGSALCFNSGQPHQWTNAGDEPAEIVLAGTPPSIF